MPVRCRLPGLPSWFIILLLAGGLLPAGALPAQTAAPLTAEARAAIEAVRATVEAATLEEGQRQAALAQLDAAIVHQREAEALLGRLAALRAGAADQPARMEQLRAALALDRDQALMEWAARLPADADGETLERLLEQERGIIAGLNAQIDSVTAELAQALSRPAQALSEITVLRRRIEELSSAAAALEEEPAALVEARRIRRASELRRVQAELDLRSAEQETGTQRQRLHELNLRELRFRQGLHARRVEFLQARIADLGRQEVEALISGLIEREAALAGTRGPVATAAGANRALGEELIEQTDLLARDRDALAAFEQTRSRTSVALRDSRTRLELGGASEAVGRWLWSERRRLESPARLRQRLEGLRSTLAELRLRLVILSEQQRDLLDIGAAARALAEAGHVQTDDDGAEAAAAEALEPLLQERVELLALLEPLQQRRIAALEQSERALQEQIDDTLTLQQLLDRHLLWTPSHAPIGLDWIQRVPEGLYDLVKPSRFATTLELSARAIGQRPLPWLGGLLLLLALVELRRRAPAYIEAQAAVTRQVRRDNYEATLQAFGWTLVAALPGPAALLLLGQLLQTVGNPGRYSDSLGRACVTLVVPLFAVQVLRWTVMERGLGHAHFRWMRPRREALRRWLPVAAGIVLPMYYISSLAFIRNLDLPNDVQARIAIVVACATLGWTFWRLLDVGRIWVIRGAASEPSLMRKLLRVLLPATALVVALLALGGYVYSAGMLLQTLLDTLLWRWPWRWAWACWRAGFCWASGGSRGAVWRSDGQRRRPAVRTVASRLRNPRAR